MPISQITGASIADASIVQTDLASGIASNGPAFNAGASGTFTVANNTDTKVPINTETFDTNNCFDTSTYRFTPNVAGYYQVQGAVFISPPNNTSGFILSIFKNGALFQQVHRENFQNYFNQLAQGGTVVYCNGTSDYIELYIWQNGGSTQTFGNNSLVTWFSGAMIRAA
jgi:hypothetical protein